MKNRRLRGRTEGYEEERRQRKNATRKNGKTRGGKSGYEEERAATRKK